MFRWRLGTATTADSQKKRTPVHTFCFDSSLRSLNSLGLRPPSAALSAAAVKKLGACVCLWCVVGASEQRRAGVWCKQAFSAAAWAPTRFSSIAKALARQHLTNGVLCERREISDHPRSSIFFALCSAAFKLTLTACSWLLAYQAAEAAAAEAVHKGSSLLRAC